MTTSKGYTFVWYECATTDATAGKSFYSKLFGWQAAKVSMPGMEGHYTLLEIVDQDITGLNQMEGNQFEGVPSHWMTYIHVDNVDESAQKIDILGRPSRRPGHRRP
jgi:predicted enzyme related to lactoylglutathione lyase